MVSPTWSESVGGRGAEESTKSGGFTLVPSVSQFRRAPPPTTPPSQRTAPLPSVNTSTVLSTRSLGRLNFASEVGLSQHSG